MYPELYQKWFKLNLNPTELILIEVLMKVVGLLSKATLGQIANNLPLPILADREFWSKHLATWLREIGWGSEMLNDRDRQSNFGHTNPIKRYFFMKSKYLQSNVRN